MSNPFLAEIRIFPFSFAPKGWALCNGQLMAISQNTALFALLGTTYGGDGKSTYALPDLQGSAPMHIGGFQPGPGLSQRVLGEIGGSDTVTLLSSEMPVHAHTMMASNQQADVQQATPTVSLGRPVGALPYSATTAPQVNMASQMLPPAGGSLPHNNLMPYLTLNFCIALQGIFPART